MDRIVDKLFASRGWRALAGPDDAKTRANASSAVPTGRRIAMVVNKFPTVTETFIVAKFLQLLDRGWDVHVVARQSEASQFRFFPEIESRSDVAARVHVSDNLGAQLRSLRPDLIHFEFGVIAKSVISQGAAMSAKTMVSLRGFDVAFWALDEPGYYDDVWRRANLIHAVSNDIWDRAVQRGCPPDKPHVVIPDAIDPTFFNPGERRARFGVGRPTDPLRLLSVGRLVWKKGYEFGLQAVATLMKNNIHCQYRIIGDGKERDSILYTIADLGLTGQVKLLGAQTREQVREEMLKADLFLHSSVSEGFGVSVIEAQAMELPVVCSDAEGLSENVADGVTGFVVPRRDAGALAAKLTTLAQDAELRREMGMAGRQRVFDCFHLADQTARFEDAYRQLVDTRYQAEQLMRRLMAESHVRYPRNEAEILRLAVTSSGQAQD